MSRDDGFTIADMSVAFFRDRKVRQLRSRGPEGAVAILIYVGIVLSSWEDGERLTLWESDVPFTPTAKRVAMLREVGMLDAEDRVPEAIWAAWFGPAQARKQERREAGRRGGQAKARKARATSNDVAEPVATPYPSVPLRTVVPPTPTAGGGNGSRATGDNPRAIEARAQAARDAEAAERKAAIGEIRQRYFRGEITEDQQRVAFEDLARADGELVRR